MAPTTTTPAAAVLSAVPVSFSAALASRYVCALEALVATMPSELWLASPDSDGESKDDEGAEVPPKAPSAAPSARRGGAEAKRKSPHADANARLAASSLPIAKMPKVLDKDGRPTGAYIFSNSSNKSTTASLENETNKATTTESLASRATQDGTSAAETDISQKSVKERLAADAAERAAAPRTEEEVALIKAKQASRRANKKQRTDERNAAKERRQKIQQQKQLRQKGNLNKGPKNESEKVSAADEIVSTGLIPGGQALAKEISKKISGPEAKVDEGKNNITFGNIDFGEKKKTKRGPSLRDIDSQIRRVEKKEEKLKLIAENDSAEAANAVAQKQAWTKALKQSAGEKIIDDKKKLNMALDQRKREKETSRKNWAEKKSQVTRDIAMRQKKRNENIKKRIDEKREKKIKRRKRS